MAIQAGQAYIQVVPSLRGWQADVRRQLAKELAGVKGKVPIEPDIEGAKRGATKAGEEAGGAFAQSFKRRVDAALKSLPDVKIGADSTEAQREIAAIRRELLTLSEKTVGIDIDAGEATAKISQLKARLDRLAAENPSVDVDVDIAAASAQLGRIDRQVDRLDGRRASVHVDVDRDGNAQRSSIFLERQISGLVLAGAGIAPVFVPAFAAAAAAAAGFSAALAGAGAGIGALVAVSLPAFSAVSDAVKATDQAEKAAATSAVNTTQQRTQAAFQAQQAARRVSDAQQAADRTSVEGAKRVQEAQRALGDARREVAERIEDANEKVTDSERQLERAHEAVQRAQEDLTDARREAIRVLEDLREESSDLVLTQEGAEISLARARQRLAETNKDATATLLDRREAAYEVRVAEERLSDVQRDRKRTAEELGAAEKAGVNGSEQVLAANDRLTDANESLGDAQRGVAEAQRDLARAQSDGARTIAEAEERVSEARTEAAQANADAARAVGDALEAQAQQAAMAAMEAQNGVAANRNLAYALGELTPMQRELYDGWIRLREAFQQWAQSLEPAVIPLFLQGMGLIERLLPMLTPLVVASADAFGYLLDQAEAALGSPFWKSFFDFLARTAGPAISGFGDILGNLARGFGGILMAFEPMSMDLTNGLVDLTERFADWGEGLADNPGFQAFVDYVRAVWPELKATLGAVADAFVAIIDAMAPLGGGPVLSIIRGVADAIAGMDPTTIQMIALAIGAMALALKAVAFIGAVAALGPVALAIALIAGAVAIAWVKFEGFREVVRGVVDWFQEEVVPRLEDLGRAIVRVFEEHVRPRLEDFWAWFQEDIVPVLQEIGDVILEVARRIVDWFERNWPRIQDAIEGYVNYLKWAWDTIVFPYLNLLWDILTNVVGPVLLWLWHYVAEPAFKAIAAIISWAWEFVISPILQTLAWVIETIVGPVFSWLWDVIKRVWDGISTAISFAWHFFIKPIFDTVRAFLRDKLGPAFETVRDVIGDVWDSVSTTAKNVWERIVGTIRNAVNLAIRIINGIGNAIEWVAGKIGIDIEIPDIPLLGADGRPSARSSNSSRLPGSRGMPLAAGGQVPVDPNRSGPFITNGARAIVGEGSPFWPEYVIPTDPRFRGRALGLFSQLGGDLMASGGRIPMLARGGPVPEGIRAGASQVPGVGGLIDAGFTVAEAVKRITDAARGIGDFSWDLLKKGGTWLKDKAIGWATEKVRSAIEAFAGSAAGIGRAYMGGTSPGVEKWRATALEALRMTGSPLSWINSLLRRMNQESGGNQFAINLWDSNAMRGDPSMGLMQNIRSAYASRVSGFPSLRGTSPYHPLGSIVASIVYANQRYGKAPIGWDRAGGYFMGGVLPPFLGSFEKGLGRVPHDGLLFAHRDEAVLDAGDAAMWRAAAADSVKARGGLPPIHQEFYGLTDPVEIARTTGDEVAWQVRVG
jgi:hypothetical protein